MGHARALLALADVTVQQHAARQVVAQALSVRDTEALVRRLGSASPATETPRRVEREKDVHTRAAEDRMRFALGTKVRIVRHGNSGTIEIAFTSESELNRLYELLTAK